MPVALIGPPELIDPECEDRGQISGPDCCTTRGRQVADDIGQGQPYKVIYIEMGFGENAFEGHGLAAITVLHSVHSLIVNMNDLGVPDVGYLPTLGLHPLCPLDIFETRQRFVISMPFPQTFSNGCIGIITKWTSLPRAITSGNHCWKIKRSENLVVSLPRCLPYARATF
jgi:hypothetical protein